jgi:hypothetical protein
MSLELYLVDHVFSSAGDLPGFRGYPLPAAPSQIQVFSESPTRRLATLLESVGVTDSEAVWETRGYLVEIVFQPDASSFALLGASVRTLEEAAGGDGELVGIYDALMDVADGLGGTWFSPELGGRLTRGDRERFLRMSR